EVRRVPAHVLQEEIVHLLVDAGAAVEEPVLDPRQGGDDAAGHPGLLADLADGRLLRRLSRLDVPFRQLPALRLLGRDEEDARAADDQAAGGALMLDPRGGAADLGRAAGRRRGPGFVASPAG